MYIGSNVMNYPNFESGLMVYQNNVFCVCNDNLKHCKKILFISQYLIVIFTAHYCKAGFPHFAVKNTDVLVVFEFPAQHLQ